MDTLQLSRNDLIHRKIWNTEEMGSYEEVKKDNFNRHSTAEKLTFGDELIDQNLQPFHKWIDIKHYWKETKRNSRWEEDQLFNADYLRHNSSHSEKKFTFGFKQNQNLKNMQMNESWDKRKRKTFSVGLKYETFLNRNQRHKDLGKKTLVLDLDETLVHSSFEIPKSPPLVKSFTISVKWDDGVQDKVFVRVRPHLQEFLNEVCKLYEVVIFTASVKNYAVPLIKKLDKSRYGYKILSRSHWTKMMGNYFKDLSLLGRDLRNVIILDNSPDAYALNRVNGIPIESWYSCPYDSELKKMIPVLQMLAKVGDVREVIPQIVWRETVNYQKFQEVNDSFEEPSPFTGFYEGLK